MINRLIAILAVGLLLVTAGYARADDAAAPEYVLGIDDVIDIVVANHTELNKTTVISPDGTIVVQEAGEIKAVGLTTRKLAAAIQTKLEETLNNVAVTVALKE